MLISNRFFLLIFVSFVLNGKLIPQILLEEPFLPDNSFLPILLNEGFNSSSFPPYGWSRQNISGNSQWEQATNSANCLGFGSARFPFYTANAGDVSRLISPAYNTTGAGQDTLIFYNAYASFPGVVDRLDIYTSTNSGSAWNMFLSLTTEMITAPATNTFFIPSCSQWQNRTMLLPLYTNRILFEARCNHGNNLYIDSIIVTGPYPLKIIRDGNIIPSKYMLYNNYPNPFNPFTIIRYDIAKSSFVKLVIFDINGEEIESLVNERLDAGKYSYNWNAESLPSGIYFYQLNCDNYMSTKKMILLR